MNGLTDSDKSCIGRGGCKHLDFKGALSGENFELEVDGAAAASLAEAFLEALGLPMTLRLDRLTTGKPREDISRFSLARTFFSVGTR